MKKLFILLLCLVSLPTLMYGQLKPDLSQLKIAGGVPPISRDSLVVEYATLMKIARKYGVEKNFTFHPSADNKSGKLPQKVILRMSLEQFDEWMKRFAFEDTKAKIINQFYLKDFQEVSTVEEYIALKRAYAKKYPAYLKDVADFQEETIRAEEANAENITLFTKNFRKGAKK